MTSEDMQATRAVVKHEYLLVMKRWRRAMTRVKTLRAELEQLKRAMRELGYFEVKTKGKRRIPRPDEYQGPSEHTKELATLFRNDESDRAFDTWREDQTGRHVGRD